MAADSNRATEVLEALQAELETLKRGFSRYFEGLERVPPLEARDALQAQLTRAHTLLRGNTGLLFRYNTLKASVLSQETLWNRILAQIENGTYPPHRARAAKLAGPSPAKPAAAAAGPEPASTPRDAANAPATTHPLAKVHAAYAALAAQVGAQTPSIEAMAAVLAHKAAQVRANTGARNVDVRVVLENGVPKLEVMAKAGG